jgi:hypothetical protein
MHSLAAAALALALAIFAAPLSNAIVHTIPYHAFLPAYAAIQLATACATRYTNVRTSLAITGTTRAA